MNYSEYVFSGREKMINVVVFVTVAVFVTYLFYGNIFLSVFFAPLWIPYLKIIKTRLKEKRKKELKCQFKDAITSIADALGVGFSVENAIRESYREMKIVYGEHSYICREFREIIKKIEISTTIESAFLNLAERSKIEEIILFAQVFEIAKRSGGNLVDIIQIVEKSITQSFRVEEEINVIISQKKLEQRIMYFVPVGIILYVSVTSPGFLDIMYDTIMGNVIMTICVIAYSGAFYMAEKIMRIEV